MYIIAGLGNPGDEFEGTRHNIGYAFVERFCASLGHDFFNDANTYRANKFLKTTIADQEVVFSLPLGYMNNSGEGISQIMNFYGDNKSKDLIVVHDDTEVPFGQVRIKYGGTSGGHNGIKSIDESVGADYWRVRIGIGRPGHVDHDMSDYVLGKFTAPQKETLDIVIDQTVTYLLKSLEEGKLKTITLNAKNAVK